MVLTLTLVRVGTDTSIDDSSEYRRGPKSVLLLRTSWCFTPRLLVRDLAISPLSSIDLETVEPSAAARGCSRA